MFLPVYLFSLKKKMPESIEGHHGDYRRETGRTLPAQSLGSAATTRGVTQHAVLCARIKHYLCGMLFTGANEMWRNRGKLCPRKQISTAGGD